MRKNIFGCLSVAGLLLAGSPLSTYAADVGGSTAGTTAPDTSTTTTTTTTSSDNTTTPSTTTATPTTTITIQSIQGPDGVHLADSTGHSLYIFDLDTSAKSSCTGDCAKAWVPVTVPVGQNSVTASGQANASMVGSPITRDDGSMQLTYNGMPLYTYAGDLTKGDTKGQGVKDFGGTWYLIGVDGTKLMPGATTNTSGNSGSTNGTGTTTNTNTSNNGGATTNQ